MLQAKGLAFLTVITPDIGWRTRLGLGLAISKLPDGRWSALCAISAMCMASGDHHCGQQIQFMIVLNSEQAIKRFIQKAEPSPRANVEFATVAFGCSVGVGGSLSSLGFVPDHTYSHCNGRFGGVELTIGAVAAHSSLNRRFYGLEITPTEVLTGSLEQPAAASQLYDAVNRITSIPLSNTANMLKSKFLSPFLERMPSPAVGPDIQIVYDRVLATIDAVAGPPGVEEFKVCCKEYGQNRCSDEEFSSYLTNKFTKDHLVHLIPDVIKLLQAADKRKFLWEYYLHLKSEAQATQCENQAPLRRSSKTSSIKVKTHRLHGKTICSE